MLSSLLWNALWPTDALWQEPGCTSPSLGQCFLKGLCGPCLLQSRLELRQSGTTFWVKTINSHSPEILFSQDFQNHFIKSKAQIEVTSPWRGPMHPAIVSHPIGLRNNPGGILCARDSTGFWISLLSWVSTETHISILLSSCPKSLSLLLYINFPNTDILANLTKVAKWNIAEHVWKLLT